MPTVLSPNKGYPLQQTGENSGTWGVVLDGGISSIDLNMGGRLSKDVSGGGSVTLTSTEASNLIYTFTGALTGAKAVLFPAVGSFYIVRNQTTGAFPLVVKTVAGGSVGPTIPQGATWAIFTDGTNGAQQQSGVAYGLDSGTTSAFAVTTDDGATGTYPGSMVMWTAASTNIAASTLAVDSGSAKAIYQPSASGPIQAVAGYIVAGDTLISIYNPALNTGTGGWFTIGGIPSFAAITVTDSLTITSTDAGAGAAPLLELYRNSATPVSADLLGEMLWTGMNSTPVKATYSFIETRLDNPTAAAETATLLFATAQGGTVAARMGLAAGLTIGAPTGGDKGVGALNATSLFANGNQIGVPIGYMYGLLPSTVTGTLATAAVTITSGQCTDSTGTQTITGAGFSWTVTNGNAADGYQGGTILPTNASINFFVISGTAGVASFASLSLTPTLPTGYTSFRRIFTLRTGSGGLASGTSFPTSSGYRYIFSGVTQSVSPQAPSTTGTGYPQFVPTGFSVNAIVDVMYTGTNNTQVFALVSSPFEANSTPSATICNMVGGTGSLQAALAARFSIQTDNNGNVRFRCSATGAGAGSNLTMNTIGYEDARSS